MIKTLPVHSNINFYENYVLKRMMRMKTMWLRMMRLMIMMLFRMMRLMLIVFRTMRMNTMWLRMMRLMMMMFFRMMRMMRMRKSGGGLRGRRRLMWTGPTSSRQRAWLH